MAKDFYVLAGFHKRYRVSFSFKKKKRHVVARENPKSLSRVTFQRRAVLLP